MIIEKMKLQDIGQVTKLAEQLGYPNTRADIEARFLEIQNLQSHTLFVAKETSNSKAQTSDKILGWVQVNREVATLLSEPRAEITALVVDETQRGKKIGKQLLDHAEKWAVENGLRLVRLRSNVKRTDAHRFYQREGYEIQKSWHLFVKELK